MHAGVSHLRSRLLRHRRKSRSMMREIYSVAYIVQNMHECSATTAARDAVSLTVFLLCEHYVGYISEPSGMA
jgi:hypothetical protein